MPSKQKLFYLLIACLFSLAPLRALSQDAATGARYGLNFVKQSDQGTWYQDAKGKASLLLLKDYQFVDPIANKQVVYDYSLKNKTQNYEVRVRFDKLTPTLEEFQACQKKNQEKPGSCSMAHPDAASATWAQAMLMNLSGGQLGQFTFFPADAVKNEFNADWGLTSSVFKLKDKTFSGPYSLGQITQVHKNGIGTYTMIYVFDDKALHDSLFEKVFYALTFLK